MTIVVYKEYPELRIARALASSTTKRNSPNPNSTKLLAVAEFPKPDADDVCHDALRRSNPCHLETTRPPRTNGDERLCRAHSEVSQKRDNRCDDYGRDSI